MDYPLENLGPERFQELCQALLVREQPDVQCFPVAQPDGGRDAVSYVSSQHTGKFIMFQVKFTRRPHAETDPHKWLLSIMEEEIPKVQRLIPKGAAKFFLITNIPGTAHLDAGSIDRLNADLSETLDLPFMCWWRDDISRRLDNAWALKWVYPEIMTGTDFLRAIVDSGLSEDRERRASAIRAFLAYQFKLDEEVRFKQVELQNDLLDLFIDVPVGLRDQYSPHIFAFARIAHNILRSMSPHGQEMDRVAHLEFSGEVTIGAASLLLAGDFQALMPEVVLEGAPGQGKSTIAQYVCQVHRLRLLKHSALSRVPAEHRAPSHVRLPIKVDLRDFATWLAGLDPFSKGRNDEQPSGWLKSLEAFLAALVSIQSGGTSFGPDDLIALA